MTANAQGKVYGAADPSLTYSVTGFQFGETAALMTGALDRLAGENVGSYGIGQGTLAAGSNYTLAYTGADLTITPRALSIVAHDVTKTVGDTVTFLGAEFTATGLISGDSVTAVTLTSGGAHAGATAAGSPYAITPSNAVGTGLTNYVISYVNGQLVVLPVQPVLAARGAPASALTPSTFAAVSDVFMAARDCSPVALWEALHRTGTATLSGPAALSMCGN